MTAKIPLSDQLKAFKGAIAILTSTWARAVLAKEITQEDYARNLAPLEAAYKTFELMAKHEGVVRTAIREAIKAEKHPAVQNFKEQFPDAEMTDVRESD